MTSNTKEDLEKFKETLTPEEMRFLESIINSNGEEYAISILGHLKESLEIARFL